MTDLVRRLRELLETAEPGDWHTWKDPLDRIWRIDHKIPDNTIIVGLAVKEENAQLIVALRNEASALLDLIESLQRQFGAAIEGRELATTLAERRTARAEKAEQELADLVHDMERLHDSLNGEATGRIEAERQLREAKNDAAAVRELMHVYNLGGWTDAVGPMERAHDAERQLADCEAALRTQDPALNAALEQIAEREAFHCERVADLHKKFSDMRDWYEARLKGILDPMVQIKILQPPAPVIFEIPSRPGYALVPVEPNEAMWDAGCAAITELYRGDGGWCGREAAKEQAGLTYRAMLEASKEGGE